jgi:hypothetical protein
MDDDLLANFLAKRRSAQRKRAAEELLKRFKKAKGRSPFSVAELRAFILEEQSKGNRS